MQLDVSLVPHRWRELGSEVELSMTVSTASSLEHRHWSPGKDQRHTEPASVLPLGAIHIKHEASQLVPSPWSSVAVEDASFAQHLGPLYTLL